MNLFFSPDINSETHFLSQEESKHCAKVLRLTTGDKINLIDGKGSFYEAEIIELAHNKCKVKILTTKKEFGKRNFYLHLAVSPTKNIERFEWFLEKATEIGIDEISPIICQHSERSQIKTDRLNKILISAIKQSLNGYLPALNEIKRFEKFISSYSQFQGHKFIAHCQLPEMTMQSAYKKTNNALILIGPEGDFTKDEIQLALQNGFQSISLGNKRLRTETAAVVACHTVNLINEQ